MAKILIEDKILPTILIISKDEFLSKIQEQIDKGKDLLSINVDIISTNPYTKPNRVKYSEKEQIDFFLTYTKWDNYNKEILKYAFNNIKNEYRIEYENSSVLGYGFDLINEKKETIQRNINILESIIERLEMIPIQESDNQQKATSKIELTNKIFIVHGHGDLIKQTIARTLLQLGLEPIILHEQPDGGKTIIEKFEKNSSDVNFAIVLLTADDEGKAKSESNYKARARQNVVFEMGFFIGKLGREKVFLLLDHGVEKPGDLDGIVYTSIDPNDGWKLKLVKELKEAGYSISADRL